MWSEECMDWRIGIGVAWRMLRVRPDGPGDFVPGRWRIALRKASKVMGWEVICCRACLWVLVALYLKLSKYIAANCWWRSGRV